MAKELLDNRLPVGIGYRLTLTREVLGKGQQDFADAAGINASAYNQYERGKRRISVEHAHKLCDHYHLTLDWIYRGDISGLKYQTVEAIRALRTART